MSTIQRVLLIAFTRPGRPTANRRRAGDAGAATLQSMGSEVLTCAPWAGLHTEGPEAS